MSGNIITKTQNVDNQMSNKATRELNKTKVALRRINFLSKRFCNENPYLDEIFKISQEVLQYNKGVEHD